MGTTRLAHLQQNLAASGLALPPETLAAIRARQA
jgi:aryl-alcohol dehydrogenase-like predicted oxidoreductase